MRTTRSTVVLMLGLALALSVAAVPAGTALVPAVAPDAAATPPMVDEVGPAAQGHGIGPGDSPDPLAHTDHDAECFLFVNQTTVLDHDSCSDTWTNADGRLPDTSAGGQGTQWHTGVHNLVLFGRVTMSVDDADGTEVFRRNCVWAGGPGISGVCTVFIAETATAGTWTMTLDAQLDAAISCAICAGDRGVHGWVDF